MKQYQTKILVLLSLFITLPLQAFAQDDVQVFFSKATAADSGDDKLAEGSCHSCFVTSKDKNAAARVFAKVCTEDEESRFMENINGTYYVSTQKINFEEYGHPFSCEDKCVDTDGDGWGWNIISNESCQIKHHAPVAGDCIDSDGDGWGWNGVASCTIEDSEPVTTECVDTDGDGFGWNGKSSCDVETGNVIVDGVVVDITQEELDRIAATVQENIQHMVDTQNAAEEEAASNSDVETTVDPAPETDIPTGNPVATTETETESSTEVVDETVEENTEEEPVETVTPPPAEEETIVVTQSGTTEEETEVETTTEVDETTEESETEEVANPPVDNTAAQEIPETPVSTDTTSGPTQIDNTAGVTLEDAEDGICIDDNNDGYGWDGEKSCRVLGFVDPVVEALNTPTTACAPKAAGTTLVSSASPLGTTGDSYYPDTGEQCVYFGNQYNGPGLFYGDFKFSNNAWNAKSSSFGDVTDEDAPHWEQCISLLEKADGTFAAHLTFDWGNEYQINEGYMEWAVKSYPNLLFGTSSRGDTSGDCKTTGLPSAYKDIPKYTIDFKYSASNTENREGGIGIIDTEGYWPYKGADRNVAIESFFHTTCDIKRDTEFTASNKQYEIMVWLEKGLERVPSGDPAVGVFTDSKGQAFDVFTKPRSDDGYVAYVARDTLREGSLEWNDFIEDAKANSEKYGIKPFQDSWCLGNIMLGSEIWWGEGEITVDEFKITSEF